MPLTVARCSIGSSTQPACLGEGEELSVDPGRRRRTLPLAYAGSIIGLTGVQLIVPALPLLQRSLGLSDVQLGVFTAVYLLPGVLLAAPIGFLADRLGRKVLFVASSAVFGLAGGLLFGVHDVPTVFLLRGLQGVAFACLFPLTLTMVGDVTPADGHVREQGRRSIYMALADVALPMVGAAVVALGTFAPFLVQTSALGLAVLGLLLLPHDRGGYGRPTSATELLRVFRTAPSIALQLAGLYRFLFKFVIYSYGGLLLFDRGFSPQMIGVMVGLLSVANVLAAAACRAWAYRFPGPRLIALALVAAGAGMAITAAASTAPLLVLAFWLLGLADGLLGVLTNAYMMEMTDSAGRGSYVAMTGAVRNLGKFAAPTLAGGLLWLLPLSGVFGVFAVLAFLAPITLRPLGATASAQPELRR
ncbi:MAG TPA: MFS transporter [Candidatus Limnocylindria bacterium]|nr:MFS transporter [Candidatus Limnocylindria bacterium]